MGQLREENRGVVCVTGASGFVASWLVKKLLERGYYVRGTVRDPNNLAKTNHLRTLPGAKERLELWRADLLEEGSFDDVIFGCEGVFHTAMLVTSLANNPQVEVIDPAVNGTLNVLRSCKKTSTIKRVVVTSSSSTIRIRNDIEPEQMLDEKSWSSLDICYQFKIWYAIGKVLAERATWDFAKKHDLDVVTIHPSFIVGPVLPQELCLTAFDTLEFLKGNSSKFAYNGRMGYVHIDDVAIAHILAYEDPTAEGRYNCSSIVLEVNELAKILASRHPDLKIPQEFKDNGERPRYLLDSSKILKLGLSFKTIEEMFDDCISSFRTKGLLP